MMVDELIKNIRTSVNGRKLLSSQEKEYLVEEWKTSGLSCPEFCRRHGLIASQLYKWRTDAKRNGKGSKRLKTISGEIELTTSQDRKSTFEPQIVRKRKNILAVSLTPQISLFTVEE